MKRNIVWIGCVLCLFVPRVLYAQSAITYPGSLWSSTGTVTPAEPGNVISLSHVTQGVSYKGIELFEASTLGMDSKGYDWNNRVQVSVGVALNQTVLNTGVVRVSAAYSRERRWVSNRPYTGMVYAVDFFTQWKGVR